MTTKFFQTGIVVTGDARGGVRALGLTQDQVRKLNATMAAGTATAQGYSASLRASAGSSLIARQAAFALTNQMRNLSAAFGVFESIRLADQYDDLQARLSIVTETQQEFLLAQQETFRIAQDTSQGLRNTIDLYGRLEISLDDLGTSQTRILRLTETINQAFAVSGASAQETSAAIIQLAQGLAAGALRGDEFRSVSEQGTRVLKALRDGLGVTQGELREMANAGELTAEVVLGALESQAVAIEREFQNLPLTARRAFTQLRNSFTQLIGEGNQVIPVVRFLAESLQFVALNLDTLATGILLFAGVRALAPLVAGLIAAVQTVRNFGLAMLGIEAAIAATTVKTAVLSKAFLLLGGPVGLGVAATLGVIAAGWAFFNREAAVSVEKTDEVLERLRLLEGSEIDLTVRTDAIDDALDRLDELSRAIEGFQAEQARAIGRTDLGGIGAEQQRGIAGENIDRAQVEIDRVLDGLQQLGVSADDLGDLYVRRFGEMADATSILRRTVGETQRDMSPLAGTVGEFAVQTVASVLGVNNLAQSIRGLAGAAQDADTNVEQMDLGTFADEIAALTGQLDPAAGAVLKYNQRVAKLNEEFEKGGSKDVVGFSKVIELSSRVLNKQLADLNDNTAALEAQKRAQEELNRAQLEYFELTNQISSGGNPQEALLQQLATDVKELTAAWVAAGAVADGSFGKALQQLTDDYKASMEELESYNVVLKEFRNVMVDLEAEELLRVQIAIEEATEKFGEQSTVVQTLIELYRRLQLAQNPDVFAVPGLFGLTGDGRAIENFQELLSNAFDEARSAGSFRQFFDAIVDGFREASRQGGEALAAAVNSAAQFGAFAVNSFRNNPDSPLRALTEVASQIPGIVGQVAQTVAAVDSIFGGRLLGTNFETDGSGRNFSFGAGGFSGGTFENQSRQRSFFRGTARRTIERDLDPAAQRQLDLFFDEVSDAISDSARRLGVAIPQLIAGNFEEEFDADGNLVRSVSSVLGRTFEESFEEFTTRVLAENLLGTLAGAVGDREVTRQLTVGDLVGREFLGDLGSFGGVDLGRVIGETVESVNEVQFIAERWRDNAELLLEGAQFLLVAQDDIQRGVALLRGEGGLLELTDLTESLAFGSETLTETYLRLVDSTALAEDVFRAFNGTFEGTREGFVRFSSELVDLLGGLDAAGQAFTNIVEQFFSPEEALQLQLDQAATIRNQLLSEANLSAGITGAQFRDILTEAIDGGATPERLATLIQLGDVLATISGLERELADVRSEAAELEQERVNSLRELLQGLDETVRSSGQTEFQQQLTALAQSFREAMTEARALGADTDQLAQVQARFAFQQQQLIDQLRLSTLDLGAQLFGTPLTEIEARIAELQAQTSGGFESAADGAQRLFEQIARGLQRITEFVNDLLLDESLTTLTPRQRVNEAERQFLDTLTAAQGGDVDALNNLPDIAREFLTEARDFFASSDAFTDIFNFVTNALNGLNVTAPTGDGGGGGGTSPLNAELQSLLAERDRLLAQQEEDRRRALAEQLAQNVADLSAATGATLEATLEELGIDLADLVSALGIDIANLSQDAADELLNLARTLNVELSDLSTNLGLDLGSLGSNDSFLNTLLVDAVNGLPPELSNQLQPLLQAIQDADTDSTFATAVDAFSAAVLDLPLTIQQIFAPLFDDVDIDPADLLGGEVTLADTNSILDVQTSLLREIASGRPITEPKDETTPDGRKNDLTLLEEPLVEIADGIDDLPGNFRNAVQPLVDEIRDLGNRERQK
ncbi:MAG: tape measure protein [Pseudomonadota bacterium]